jgi:hypothetical protein
MSILFMALIGKIGRIARLLGILGVSLGSLVISACSGKTELDGDADTGGEVEDIRQDEASADGTEDVRGEEAQPRDITEEEPDTDLWEVICE